MSIALTLEDELDISRGEMLASAHEPPAVATNFSASMVWMNAEPLDLAKTYLLKHASRTVKARVAAVQHRVNMQTVEHEPASTLELNSIGEVEVETTLPLFLDPYAAHRQTGSFILIDPVSNATVAAGMVRAVLGADRDRSAAVALGMRDVALLRQVESQLIESGIDVVRTRSANSDLIQRLLQIGVIVLVESDGDLPETVTAVNGFTEAMQLLNRETL
jgi:sulfate adenylyltransferase subunit 1 (EFTu-like GTPase family)